MSSRRRLSGVDVTLSQGYDNLNSYQEYLRRMERKSVKEAARKRREQEESKKKPEENQETKKENEKEPEKQEGVLGACRQWCEDTTCHG